MELVTVIVPAYNAERTVAESLESIRSQSHQALEILVVDDGSTDSTPEIVRSIAAADRRIRLISTPNQGVARARNAGIDMAQGAFIAPIDADDLWHPLKIELQLKAFERSPGNVALVYNWFRRIDEAGFVVENFAAPLVEGNVIHRHLQWNFISNGSTPLIKRSALDATRYQPALRDAGNEGCEDYYIQLEIANRAAFACAPGFLTGYRRTPNAMSKNVARMIRSHIQTLSAMQHKVPAEAQAIIRARIADFNIQYARNRVRRGKLGDAILSAAAGLKLDGVAAVGALKHEFSLGWQRTVGRKKASGDSETMRQFLDWDVEEGWQPWQPEKFHLLAEFAELDNRQAARFADSACKISLHD